MHFDFLIVGAGFYGATFARLATDAGYKCLVIDRRDHVAGNAHTRLDEETNILVHEYGPHIFHTNDEEIWSFVNKYGRFNNYSHTVKADVFGTLYSLPFNMNTFNQLYSVKHPGAAKIAIQKDIIPCHNIKTVADFALATVGDRVYRTLIKEYTEKQWGKDCHELPASIIKRLPIRWTYDDRYFNDRYQGIPEQGYTALVEAMLEGIEVLINTDYRELNSDVASTTVYSGAIDEFFNYRFGHLEYRSLEFIEKRDHPEQGISVINYPEKGIPYTRAIDHKYFNPERNTTGNVRTYEHPIKWEPGMEPFYPVNTSENQDIYDKYRELAKETNVIFGGRLGTYRYYDMHQVIGMAMKDFRRWHSSLQAS